ncbi:Hypothetical protein GbCGDNIH3_7076 [Granulibacter bethesdensis]|uniref:Uncharacterized protein n=1 Tax=Granulibacter bethesdensis TaxID=364410 RepID=A0AAN0RE81_9PROT|nr:hypothetical protein [Granulibacter bethesdensis]AHJ63232.1 Hypothetical protein GbCGDNIH3_7076 [Granulibacter bethesdensis]
MTPTRTPPLGRRYYVQVACPAPQQPRLIGPFPTNRAATAYAAEHLPDQEWTVVFIPRPDHAEMPPPVTALDHAQQMLASGRMPHPDLIATILRDRAQTMDAHGSRGSQDDWAIIARDVCEMLKAAQRGARS